MIGRTILVPIGEFQNSIAYSNSPARQIIFKDGQYYEAVAAVFQNSIEYIKCSPVRAPNPNMHFNPSSSGQINDIWGRTNDWFNLPTVHEQISSSSSTAYLEIHRNRINTIFSLKQEVELGLKNAYQRLEELQKQELQSRRGCALSLAGLEDGGNRELQMALATARKYLDSIKTSTDDLRLYEIESVSEQEIDHMQTFLEAQKNYLQVTIKEHLEQLYIAIELASIKESLGEQKRQLNNLRATLMSNACKSKDFNSLCAAIRSGARPDSQTLTWACFTGDLSFVNEASRAGAKPDTETLSMACSTFYIHIVKRAIELGAEPSAKTFEIALKSKNVHIITIVKEALRKKIQFAPYMVSDSLTMACQTGDRSLVHLASSRGAHPDGKTLTWACFSDNPLIVDDVIRLGSKPDVETLSMACSTYQLAIIEKTLAVGAKPNSQTLAIATQSRNFQIIKIVSDKLRETML